MSVLLDLFVLRSLLRPSIILHQPVLPQRLEVIDFGIDQGGAVLGDVEVGIAGGFADDDEAGGFGGLDVFGGDFDEEAAGCFAEEEASCPHPPGICSAASINWPLRIATRLSITSK